MKVKRLCLCLDVWVVCNLAGGGVRVCMSSRMCTQGRVHDLWPHRNPLWQNSLSLWDGYRPPDGLPCPPFQHAVSYVHYCCLLSGLEFTLPAKGFSHVGYGETAAISHLFKSPTRPFFAFNRHRRIAAVWIVTLSEAAWSRYTATNPGEKDADKMSFFYS